MEKDRKSSNKHKPRGKASISEILTAFAAPNGKPPAKWAAHHAELVRLRDHLTGQRRVRTANAQAQPLTTGEHMADAATDSYDRDWALALASSDQNILYEVEEALNRIASGTYGRCDATGKPIESARLKALPWTRFCAAAQAELEARGAAARTHLGALGSYHFQPSEAEEAEEEEAEERPAQRQAA